MTTAADLLHLPRPELMALLRAGHPIDPAALDDREYHGISLGLPALVERLTWKKFIKAFHRDPRSGRLRGWNVRAVQDGLDRPWRARERRGAPWTFGHFAVRPADGALLLDYGRVARLRDPLVAVNRGSADLLLGWTYLDLGVARMPTPSFFSLERGGVLSHLV